jgi:sorting nexin-1/2
MTRGLDSFGNPFEGTRRYNEFYLLRDCMRSSWPGVYIPPIPSKKMVGNKDVKFILERRYFLERFFMQMS